MFKKIVWATDGSESADRALEQAKALAAEGDASLVAVHSVERLAGPGGRGGFTLDPDDDERQVKIRKQVQDLNETGVSATLRIVESGAHHPAHALVDVARGEGADLVVMGSRGHTALGGLLLGGVTQRLLHIAPCPVLVVPPPRDHDS